MRKTIPWLPQVQRIHHVIVPWVRETPQTIALKDAHASLTYAELRNAIDEVAASLRSAGVRPGDRVLFVAENSVATAVLVLATSALDAWSVVVNARLSPREIDDFIAHSGARRTLYTTHVSSHASAHADRHGASMADFPWIGTIRIGSLNEAAVPEDTHSSPTEQVAAMIYTSGTSGKPKAVMLTHANILFAAEAVRDVRKVRPEDRLYGVMPMAHVVGLSNQLLGSLLCGATLILEPQFRPEGVVKAFLEDRITAMTGVPAMFAKLLEWSKREGIPIRAPHLRMITVAGSPLTAPLKSAVEEVFGLPLHNGYGLTEMSPTVASTAPDAPRADCSVGKPIPGVEVRFVDSQSKEVPSGQVGELWARGPNVMKGYYKNPELSREVVNADGWFNTGDLARQDADGALHIVGRTKELIIRSGFNVYPIEVEQVLNAHPDVVQSAVVGRVVADNEEVVAFVEVTANSAPTPLALEKYLRERLSPYKVPAEIRLMEHLPAAPTGKVLKHVLKEMAKGRDNGPG